MNAYEVGLARPAALPADRSTSSVRHRLMVSAQLLVAVGSVVAVCLGTLWFDSDPAIWVLWGTWYIGELIPAVIAFAAAGVILLRYPAARAVGWTMLACALSWGLSVLAAGAFIQSFGLTWLDGPLMFNASAALQGLGFYTASLVLPQVFPNGLPSGWVWRVLLGASLLAIAGAQFMQAWYNVVSFDELSTFEPVTQEQLSLIGTATWWLGMLIAIASLVTRFVQGGRVLRQQVALFAVIWLVTVLGTTVLGIQVGDQSDAFVFATAAWPPAAVALVAIAVVRFRLYEIRPIVRRAAVFAGVALVLTGVFVAVYAVVVGVLSTTPLVDERWRWIAIAAGLLVVLAADPWRRRLRVALERRLLGTRGDPLRSMARLSSELTTPRLAERSEQRIVHRQIVDTVLEAVRAPSVALVTYPLPGSEEVTRVGAEPQSPLTVPLLHRSERLGELRIAARTPGESYSRADRALLDQLAGQAAAIVYGMRRDRELDQLRREAIEAMAEHRMVLGRDLHDGLAPLLAGAGLTADALRRGMPPDSPDAEEAARLSTRLRNAATEVRRIAHDLQPLGAGADGLAGLVSDHIRGLAGPSVPAFTLHLAELRGRSLPPVVELGMSRVALEAINNVIRHAGARRAGIELRHDGGRLSLVVTDDGVGIGESYVSGLGITSMRARTEAMGGEFDVSAVDGGGTRLTASVPVSR